MNCVHLLEMIEDWFIQLSTRIAIDTMHNEAFCRLLRSLIEGTAISMEHMHVIEVD